MAQIFSVNSVGYVKVSVPAHSLAMLANPLNGTANDLNTILPINAMTIAGVPLKDDGSQDGAVIFLYDTPSRGYKIYIWSGNGDGTGSWVGPDSNPFNPGQGFFFFNVLSSQLDVTFVGEVPQGSLSNPIPGEKNPGAFPSTAQLSQRSSQVPQQGSLGAATMVGTLLFPAADGDFVYGWDVAGQMYVLYGYSGTPGVDGSWLGGNNDPAGPVLPVANSFFVLKNGPTLQSWTRTFSVN